MTKGQQREIGMSMLNEEPDPIFLSGNIRLLRKKMNLSQEELATKVGLNRGNIASYEKGTAEPKICNLVKFARVFRVSIMDLTRRDLQKEGPQGVDHAIVNVRIQVPGGFDRHLRKIEELRTVVKSLYNCHQFNIDQQENPSKELQTSSMHFDQLYELTQVLLEKHEQLVKQVSGTAGRAPSSDSRKA